MNYNFKKIRLLGCAFAKAHSAMSPAQKARLRRAAKPTATQEFWSCWAAAERTLERLSDKEGRARAAALLGLLLAARLFEASSPSEDPFSASFGRWLAAGREVPERRVEAVLMAKDSQGVITELQGIAGMKRRDCPSLDIGSFLCDLLPRRLSTATVTRWADDYFSATQKQAQDQKT